MTYCNNNIFYLSVVLNILINTRTSQQQRTTLRHQGNDTSQKQLLQHIHRTNIRKYLLKGRIGKRVTAGNECETNYSSDTAISSDENSDCCSEPTNESGGIEYQQELEKYSNKKRYQTDNTDSKCPQEVSTSTENDKQNIGVRHSPQLQGNHSGSLQNVFEHRVRMKKYYGN